MTKFLLPLLAVAQRHALLEQTGDLEGLMETMEGEPVYEVHPLGMRFKGMAATRRYYEHFFSDFSKRIVSGVRISEMIGSMGVAFEHHIIVNHPGEAAPTKHRTAAILSFGEKGIIGERISTDERLARLMLGPLWDELEPIE